MELYWAPLAREKVDAKRTAGSVVAHEQVMPIAEVGLPYQGQAMTIISTTLQTVGKSSRR